MDELLDHADWRTRNVSTVVLALVRAVRDPALAWDVAMEAMAAATLAWSTFPGGSRMSWVLAHGHRVLHDAAAEGRVSHQERRRNRGTLSKALTADEQRQLKALAHEPLRLDPEAEESLARLEREAPAPAVLLDIALSPLTLRSPRGARSRERHDG